jgi:hypothetical protein
MNSVAAARVAAARIVAAAACIGCANDVSGPARARLLPTVSVLQAISNPSNVLAVSVQTTVRDADSVRIHFRLEGETGDSVTPAVVAGDTLQLPVYGLREKSAYTFRAVAFGPGGVATSNPVTLTTGELPADLPAYRASGTSSTPGYVVFGAGRYGLVIDNSGRVVWYHEFAPSGPGLNFIAQPNGRYAAEPPAASGSPAVWVEVDPDGTVTRTFGCANALTPRFHDLIREPDDSYWLICDDVRTMDLSALGGNANARVIAAEIQHVGPDNALRFRWNAFDQFDITDLDSADRSGPTVNWTHANAIALTGDGTLLVSFRNLSEITAINTSTGAVVWRLGGKRDQFGFAECCAPMFARQHGVRVASDGSIVFLDNSGTAGDSRVRRILVNAPLHRAEPEGAFSASPPAVAGLGGSVQELPSGNLLVAFGDGRRVQEFDSTGRVVWRLDGDPGYVFRAQRIRSLYAPGVGSAR